MSIAVITPWPQHWNCNCNIFSRSAALQKPTSLYGVICRWPLLLQYNIKHNRQLQAVLYCGQYISFAAMGKPVLEMWIICEIRHTLWFLSCRLLPGEAKRFQCYMSKPSKAPVFDHTTVHARYYFGDNVTPLSNFKVCSTIREVLVIFKYQSETKLAGKPKTTF